MNKVRVMVGLSGGVDSAVSAALLQRAGATVVGAFIKTWQPDWIECTWKEERRDAMRVAAHLDIPFVTIDLEEEYKRGVADYMIAEYRAGRTPNPDVMCNKEIKFGAFLKRALEMGADMIATGHYAQNRDGLLLRGSDEKKDQSYFLWTLNQEQLSKAIFPVGHLQKSEVRELAKQFKLPVAEKRDSQGICFLGHVDMKDFLSHYIETKPGEVLDETGIKIGEHKGALFYTLGEKIFGKYVLSKDVDKNTLSIGTRSGQVSKGSGKIKIYNINWISGAGPSDTVEAQLRYHGEKLTCKVVGNIVTFDKLAIAAPGQSIVFYQGEECLGGGVID